MQDASKGKGSDNVMDTYLDDILQRRRKKEEIRSFTDSVRLSFVEVDRDNILSQRDAARAAFAVKDIANSRRLPFSTSVNERKLPYLPKPATYSRRLKASSGSEDGFPFRSVSVSANTSARPTPRLASAASSVVLGPSANNSIAITVDSQNLLGKSFASGSAPKQTSSAPLPSKGVEARLQEVLELMNTAKQHVNPTLLMFEAAEVFEELKMYDRAAYCFGRATVCADAAAIVDALILPRDVHYQRKLERMSPIVRPSFLAQQETLRSQHIFEESERQRQRKLTAHIRLTQLYLMTHIKDLYKAHDHIVHAFATCRGQEEHVSLLYATHQLLVAYSDRMAGKPDFVAQKQILRESAGPIADDHLRVLLDLLKVCPDDPALQEWTAMRYAEKCDFPNSQHHYKVARDLRESANIDAQSLANTFSGENNQLLIAQRTERLIRNIAQNTSKAVYKEFGTSTEQGEKEDARQRAVQEGWDYAWFRGRHEDATVTVYVPPPQGWG